jgi:hypothetical protein
MPNPYVQVALTYVRRPLSSWFAGLGSALFVCMIIAFAVADRAGCLRDSVFVQIMIFFSLFLMLALHMKGQFVDSRAHLTPGFRRVHATVAAIAALLSAVVLPAALSWFMGWHSMGFVAATVLLFGTVLWVTVNDATWIWLALLAGWGAFSATASGVAWFQKLIDGQIEPQALALLGLGTLITLLAGIRLVRLNGDRVTYYRTLRWDWDWDWSEKTRQGWSGQGRILSGLEDWICERQMTRLTRHARRASASPWSRICRWQAGMVADWWSLGVPILLALVLIHAVNWWLAKHATRPEAAMAGIAFLCLTLLPFFTTAGGMFYWRKMGHALLLPVERKSYIRQLIAAGALCHWQFWGSTGLALALWWLLFGPRPVPLASFPALLAFSAAFQAALFGVLVWTARCRSRAIGVFAVAVLFPPVVILEVRWTRCWAALPPGKLPSEVLWGAGVLAVVGLLITWDAYRRWLTADFD